MQLYQSEMSNNDSTNITIIYDNHSYRNDLECGWGFSCFIEKPTCSILFDTGWDGYGLLYNLEILGIDINRIDTLFLSHGHWDHIGGLPHILALKNDITLFLPTSFSKHLKSEISKRSKMIEVVEPIVINDYMISTGELGEDFKEHSLLVRTNKGIVVITGCSHPGLCVILNAARKFGKIYGVIGGFHGFNDYGILKNIDLIMPCHCTENSDKIAQRFPEAFTKNGVGKILKI